MASSHCVTKDGVIPVDWNDNYFEERYFAQCKIPEAIEFSSSLNAAGAFLNWYVSGETSENLCDLWLGVVYGMRLSWMDQTLISTDVWTDKSATETLKLPASVTRNDVFSYKNTQHPDIRWRVLKWYDELFDIMESEKIDAVATAKKQYLVNYVGFLALKLLKMLCFEEPTFVSDYIYEAMTHEFLKLWGRNFEISATYPPHSSALDEFCRRFNRHGPNANKCLAALVYSYGKAPEQDRDEVRKILNMGCLLFLEFAAFGPFDWSPKYSSLLDISILQVCKRMTGFTIENIDNPSCKTLMENLDDRRNQYSRPWARALDAGPFIEMGFDDDVVDTAAMKAIVAICDPSNPLWKLLQFQQMGDIMIRKSLHLALRMLEVVRDKTAKALE